MPRFADLHQKHETHLIATFSLLFVLNCRYLATDQPSPECAAVPLAFQVVILLATILSVRGTRSPVLKAVALLSSVVGGLTSLALSLHHLSHLLQSFISILNANVLVSAGADLWLEQDAEPVVGAS